MPIYSSRIRRIATTSAVAACSLCFVATGLSTTASAAHNWGNVARQPAKVQLVAAHNWGNRATHLSVSKHSARSNNWGN